MTNPLALIPHQFRAAVYAVVVFASIGYTAWQVSDGDWFEALGYVLAVFGGGVAVSNVRPHGRPRRNDGGASDLVTVLVACLVVIVVIALLTRLL